MVWYVPSVDQESNLNNKNIKFICPLNARDMTQRIPDCLTTHKAQNLILGWEELLLFHKTNYHINYLNRNLLRNPFVNNKNIQ